MCNIMSSQGRLTFLAFLDVTKHMLHVERRIVDEDEKSMKLICGCVQRLT